MSKSDQTQQTQAFNNKKKVLTDENNAQHITQCPFFPFSSNTSRWTVILCSGQNMTFF